MENKNIINIGKSVFGISFLLGNICLFGYIFTKNEDFAAGGFMLLGCGSILNLLIICILVMYGLCYKTSLNSCLKASSIIMINIPIAIVYAMIGLNILDIN